MVLKEKGGQVLRIVPVLDIKDGVAVHGKKGQRDSYQAVKSILVDGADPISIIESYLRALSCKEVYIADLNAIEGKGDNYRLLRQIASRKVDLLVDAGVNEVNAVGILLSLGIEKVIVGSETLYSLDKLREILADYAGRIVFSLDVMHDQILTKCPHLQNLEVEEVFLELLSLGINEFIVLFLSNVGTGDGLNINMLRKISSLKSDREIKLLAGGGIKNRHDLITLRNLGYDGALLATALHDGWITDKDLPVR